MKKSFKYATDFALVFLTVLPSVAQTTKKNIVLVMADDFNYWNKLQGYYPLVKTPNIDKLAAKGVLFSDAQASAPVSNPSRAAMFSGFRPSTTGIEGNDGGHIRDVAPFQNVVTMNQFFKNNGYYVYGIGKLYHGSAGGGPLSDQENFSFYSTKAIGCGGGSYLSWQSNQAAEYNWSVNADAMTRANCKDFDVASETAGIIKGYSTSTNKAKPFFLMCGMSKPHLAWQVPKQFYDMFNRADITTPKGHKTGDLTDTQEGTDPTYTDILQNKKWEEAIHMYISCLALSDYNAGVIFDAVESSSYKDNTIVVFMGDHGWHLGEKERFGKASPWDMGNRTTLVIYDPSYKNTSGSPNICRKVVSLQDIYPTLVELSGLPIKTDIEGNSIAALIENPNKKDWDKPVIVSRVFDRIRTNRWSYAKDRTQPAKNMLYDIVNDPNEFDNLLHVNQTKMPKAEVAVIKARLDFQFDSIKSIGLTMKTKLANSYKFNPKTLSIPGTIEAEDYDEGGYQQTYFDADKTNAGGQYRIADGTDIYLTSDTQGLYHLGGLSTGEWMNYTVKNYLAGKYKVDFRVKNTGTTVAVVQIFNRDVLLSEFSIPAKTTNWTSIPAPEMILTEQYSTRLQVKIKSGSGVEFNTMKFVMSSLSNPEITANIKRKCLINTLVTDGTLYLDLYKTDIITNIYIYDINGKLISKETLPGEQKVAYSLGNTISPGVYLLRVEDEFVSSVEKFIVK